MSVHKAIAIPIVDTGTQKKFLIVHDKRHKEWTFVTGGCKHSEVFNPLRCALRELEEETRGIIDIQRGLYSYFRFSAQPGNDPIEYSVYHVYFIHIGYVPQEKLNHLEERFHTEKMKMDTHQVYFQKNYDENDSMKFATLGDIMACKNLWKFIYDRVIKHRQFLVSISEKNAHHFNLTYTIRYDENKKRDYRNYKPTQRQRQYTGT